MAKLEAKLHDAQAASSQAAQSAAALRQSCVARRPRLHRARAGEGQPLSACHRAARRRLSPARQPGRVRRRRRLRAAPPADDALSLEVDRPVRRRRSPARPTIWCCAPRARWRQTPASRRGARAASGQAPAGGLRHRRRFGRRGGGAARCWRGCGGWRRLGGAARWPRLGADVPVCLAGRRCAHGRHRRGAGTRAALPACGLVLVNPGVAVATAGGVPRAHGRLLRAGALCRRAGPMRRHGAPTWRDLRNDLEAPAIALRPAIGDGAGGAAATPGCLLARMSGSGATCFGLFADGAAAAARPLRRPRPEWWRWGGAIAGVTLPRHGATT